MNVGVQVVSGTVAIGQLETLEATAQ